MELDEVPRASWRRGRGKAICMQESYLKGCTGQSSPMQSEVCVPCIKNEGCSTSRFRTVNSQQKHYPTAIQRR